MSSDRAAAGAPQPIASTRRRRKEQRPGEIIEAALQEFARRGFAATRLEDVAERAGVTKGTIYFYFKDKEELFKAAARSSLEPALSEIAALGANFTGSAEDLLRAHLHAVYPKLVKNPRARQILRLLIAEGPQFPELVDFYYREVITYGLNLQKRIIERGVARGEFRRTRAGDFPQVVFGPVLAAIIWNLLLAKKHPIDFDAYADAHVDLILNGLKTKPAKAK
jgi:AcrR family transcriptional regulator